MHKAEIGQSWACAEGLKKVCESRAAVAIIAGTGKCSCVIIVCGIDSCGLWSVNVIMILWLFW